MMDATVYLLKCGCPLCPAALIVRPWLTTWSTKVARISSSSLSSSSSYSHSSSSTYVSNVSLHCTKNSHLRPFSAQAPIANCKTVCQALAHEMSHVQSWAVALRILNNSENRTFSL
ncbi:hypothetical protein AMECASPLE_006704 [Ameca splendens]|uniref:Secreted protein n=1 Tax=Ameca splendens TaxID=208324 RepID=A0ABV0YAI6_9TELE